MKRLLIVTALSLAGMAHAATVNGFTGAFAPLNWTSVVGAGGAAPSIDASFLSITSPRPADFDSDETRVTIVVPSDGFISFDWTYATSDESLPPNPFYDPFGFLTGATLTQLSDDLGLPGQGGPSGSIFVSAGQIFGFFAQAIDGDFGTATTRIGNFVFQTADNGGTVPEPSTLALLAAALAGTLVARRRQVGA